ncbi:hypothetical protein J3R83DRAFT_5187 [Lanmaoa asiatica]|nr:hypothetical protein J3R83DRAFT_5187 [Lanmaoa asiatica]
MLTRIFTVSFTTSSSTTQSPGYSRIPLLSANDTFYPKQHCFIEPVHGFEVAVTGLKEIHNAADILHGYFTIKYGDVIASERMMLDHDVYCVVFRSWDTTSRVLREPFTAFSSSVTFYRHFRISDPQLLYVFNTASVHTSPVYPMPNTQAPSSESPEVMALREAIKGLEQKVAAINSRDVGLANTYNVILELGIHGTQIAQALTSLCSSLTVALRLIAT